MFKYYHSDRSKSGSGSFVGESSSTVTNVSLRVTGKEKVCEEPTIDMAEPEDVVIRKRSYEMRRQFQDNWGFRFPWVEAVHDDKGHITQVKCSICSVVEGRDKLLIPKIDGLWKHAGRRKAAKDMLVNGKKIKAGQHYFIQTNAHVKNEKLYASRPRDGVRKQVVAQSTLERKKKLVQFKCLYHVLSRGRPMTDYEALQTLCESLHVPDLPKKHWCDNSGWDLAAAMNEVLRHHVCKLISSSDFLSFSADEVTTLDNQCWVSVHAYVVKDWKRVPILLSLARNSLGQTAENLHDMIVSAVKNETDLSDFDLARKTICFAADGAATFQGCRNGVTALLTRQNAPYINGVHCCAHRTNLAADKLSGLAIVANIERLCQTLYTYFHKSPKRWSEFEALSAELEQEGLKIIRNITTRWLSVIDCVQRIQDQIPVLIAKMDEDMSARCPAARRNLDLLLDLETLFSMPAMMPLLQSVNSLIKFAQHRSCYICDFMSAVKICQSEIISFYLDPAMAFSGPAFQKWLDIVGDHTYLFKHEWTVDMNTGVEHLCLKIGEYRYEVHCLLGDTRSPVNRVEFARTVTKVQSDCKHAAKLLVEELEDRFPNHDLLSALGVVFPQFWVQPDCQVNFAVHLNAIKAFYSEQKSCLIGEDGSRVMTPILPPLDATTLDMQAAMFKMAMITNSTKIMEDKSNMGNPMEKLWSALNLSPLLVCRLSEYFKLANLAMVTLVGSVEDERTFSNLAFIKNKLRNRLGANLDTIMKLYAQDFFTLESFPYGDAYDKWRQRCERLGVAF